MEEEISQSGAGYSRRRFFKKAGVIALSASAVSTILAACGDSTATTGTSTTTTITTSAAGATTTAATGTKVKTLTVAVEQDASSLKPDTWGPYLNWYASRCLYDNLVHYKTKTGDDGLLYYDEENPEMRIAEKFVISDDRKTITWTIRDGVTFDGGKKIDAQAVVKSFQWYLDRNEVGG